MMNESLSENIRGGFFVVHFHKLCYIIYASTQAIRRYNMAQVSLNTRIDPITDRMLREQQEITGKSIASMVDDAICMYLLTVNKELVVKYTREDRRMGNED